MSSNPNNAVGTNAAYDGRTSVKAFNDGIGAYSRGILSGWDCSPSTGMTVSLGGDGTTRDIAIAEDAGGNKITVNNISEAPINVTMSAAPSTNSRIDVIVAYVDNPPQGAATSIDNPGACGLIAVDGTAAADPVAPNDSAIRTAITADGASGATAYYVVLATITIASGTTDLTSSNIAAGPSAGIGSQNIDFTTLSTQEQVVGKWVDGKTIYRKNFSGTFTTSADGSRTMIQLLTGVDNVIDIKGYFSPNSNGNENYPVPVLVGSEGIEASLSARVTAATDTLQLLFQSPNYLSKTARYNIFVYYTKTS